ncbi:Mating-type protein a-1 [Colletotrichum sp. SAR 10_98]|nr:Mating-type protein a-1 [Colletotrichum sp. SAR 10_98]
MSFHDFNPGQTIAGCMDPSRLQHDILQIAKETLDLQLNSFQSVIAVSQKDYLGLGQDGQAFMAFYMGRIFRKPVMWAKDGMDGNADRWVLGPCEKFVSGPHMIVSVNGIAIVVQRPPSHFLEDASGSEAGAHCTESPEPVCKIKVPRPPNAFILYRKDRHATMKQENSHLSNNDISISLGKKWNSESPAVRQKYTELAKMHKERLLMMYPDYRYTPRKPSEKRHRKPSGQSKKASLAASMR